MLKGGSRRRGFFGGEEFEESKGAFGIKKKTIQHEHEGGESFMRKLRCWENVNSKGGYTLQLWPGYTVSSGFWRQYRSLFTGLYLTVFGEGGGGKLNGRTKTPRKFLRSSIFWHMYVHVDLPLNIEIKASEFSQSTPPHELPPRRHGWRTRWRVDSFWML